MKKSLFIHYPKCTTCQKAAAWLDQNGIEVEKRHIVDDRPSQAEIKEWISASDRVAAKFFNTSGLRYKALNLKDRVKTATQDELVEILASEGMLVKRPVLVCEKGVLVGFKPDEWSAMLLTK